MMPPLTVLPNVAVVPVHKLVGPVMGEGEGVTVTVVTA